LATLYIGLFPEASIQTSYGGPSNPSFGTEMALCSDILNATAAIATFLGPLAVITLSAGSFDSWKGRCVGVTMLVLALLCMTILVTNVAEGWLHRLF